MCSLPDAFSTRKMPLLRLTGDGADKPQSAPQSKIPAGFRLEVHAPPGIMSFTVTVAPASAEAVDTAPTLPAVAGRIGDAPDARDWRPLLAAYLADLGLRNDGADHIEEQRLTVERAAKFGGWQSLADFRTEAVRAYMLHLHQAGRQPKTQRLYRDALHRWGAWMVAQQIIPRNPVDAIPKAKVIPRQARVVPTDDEVSRLIAGIYGRRQAKDRWLVYLMAASTGLRHGTLKSLCWSMVDLDAGVAKLPASVMKNRRPMVVHLTDELVTALRWHRATEARERVFLCVPKPEQVTADAQRAGIRMRDGGATFSFHSLRHYFSNRLMRAGATLEERKLAVGHLNGGITLETYTHPDFVRVRERVKSLQPLLSGERFCHPPGNLVDRRAVLDDTHGVTVGRPRESMVATLPQHDQTTARPGSLTGDCDKHSAATLGGPSVIVQGVAQLGRAAGLGPAGRRFKSGHPDSGEQTSPVSGEPTRIGRQVQIQCPGSDAAPANLAHLDALTAAFLASHETLRAVVAARIGGGA